MNNKKLIILNLLGLLALVAVVSFGLYRADLAKEEFAVPETKEIMEEEVEEATLEIREVEEQEVVGNPFPFMIRPPIGSAVLKHADLYTIEKTKLVEVTEEELGETVEEGEVLDEETTSTETEDDNNIYRSNRLSNSENTWSPPSQTTIEKEGADKTEKAKEEPKEAPKQDMKSIDKEQNAEKPKAPKENPADGDPLEEQEHDKQVDVEPENEEPVKEIPTEEPVEDDLEEEKPSYPNEVQQR